VYRRSSGRVYGHTAGFAMLCAPLQMGGACSWQTLAANLIRRHRSKGAQDVMQGVSLSLGFIGNLPTSQVGEGGHLRAIAKVSMCEQNSHAVFTADAHLEACMFEGSSCLRVCLVFALSLFEGNASSGVKVGA